MSADDVNFFFEMREQIKLYHWQTHSFSKHKATDELLDALDKVIDEYVEVYMGSYGRPKLGSRNNTVRLRNLNEKTIVTFVKECIAHLQGAFAKKLKPTDTQLINLRDEMLADLNKVLYLFTLQ
jgi:DNA-binding ferritin-like protein